MEMELCRNSEFWKEEREYMRALQEKLGMLSKQIKSEFDLLLENPAKDSFMINGEELPLLEFTLLLGNNCFNSKGFGGRFIFHSEAGQKKTFREIEVYLRNIPGMVMPEVPELIKKWLGKD